MNNLNKNKVISLIDVYLDELNITVPEIKTKLREFYLLELEHTLEMVQRQQEFGKIANYNFLGLIKSLDRFEYFNGIKNLETENEYFTFVVNQVNNTFGKIFKGDIDG